MEQSRSFDEHDRRKTPRLKTRCEVTLIGDHSMLDILAKGDDANKLTLFGSTLDISESGLALTVPAFLLDENFCTDEGSSLQLRLELPAGTVSLRASPVHCQPLNQRDPTDGSIVGARIVEMAEKDRQGYLKYLSQSR
jgi:hypothetical protein